MEKNNTEYVMVILISSLVAVGILTMAFFSVQAQKENSVYEMDDWKISKQDLDSFDEVAVKDNHGRFMVCKISNDECRLFGKIEE